MELQVVDPIAWVAARPAQFFRAGEADALSLLPYVLADVLLIGGTECRIATAQDWWFISSNNDWMRHDRFAVKDLFSRIIADSRLGGHSMRSEILLNVFAADIFTASSERDEQLIKGRAPTLELSAAHIDWSWAKRSLALRMKEGSTGAPAGS